MRNSRIERYFALDIETSTWNKDFKTGTPIEFYFACLIEFDSNYCEINRFMFDKLPKLIEFIESNATKEIKYFWAHNLEFDFMQLLSSLACKYKIQPIITSSILEIKLYRYVKHANLFAVFRNSYSLFPNKLEELGNAVGFPKIKHNVHNIVKDKYTKQDIKYCYRDCEIIVIALGKFVELLSTLQLEIELPSKISMSGASTSSRLFKMHNFIEYPCRNGKIKKMNAYKILSANQNDYFRNRYYFGGRTEVFDFSKFENAIYWDINSLYPYIMIKSLFPKPPYYNLRVEFAKQDHWDLAFGYECIVDETSTEIPLIPIRMKDNRVLFTAESKKCFLFKEEYEYLQTLNIPIKIEKIWWCLEPFTAPFQYMQQLYDLRVKYGTEGNKAFKYMLKIFMNSTYGKFGMKRKRDRTTILPLEAIGFIPLEEIANYDIFPDKDFIIKNQEVNLNSDFNSVLAAKITALARLEITKAIHILRKNGIKVAYTDTDSFVTEFSEKVKTLINCSDTNLGWFKQEFACEWFQAISVKEYIAYPEELKLKGTKMESLGDFKKLIEEFKETKKKSILKKAISKFDDSIDEMKEYYEKGVEIARPSKMKETLKKSVDLVHVQRTTKKKFHTFYCKRKVLSNGSTTPITSIEYSEKINEKNLRLLLGNRGYIFA